MRRNEIISSGDKKKINYSTRLISIGIAVLHIMICFLIIKCYNSLKCGGVEELKLFILIYMIIY